MSMSVLPVSEVASVDYPWAPPVPIPSEVPAHRLDLVRILADAFATLGVDLSAGCVLAGNVAYATASSCCAENLLPELERRTAELLAGGPHREAPSFFVEWEGARLRVEGDSRVPSYELWVATGDRFVRVKVTGHPMQGSFLDSMR